MPMYPDRKKVSFNALANFIIVFCVSSVIRFENVLAYVTFGSWIKTVPGVIQLTTDIPSFISVGCYPQNFREIGAKGMCK